MNTQNNTACPSKIKKWKMDHCTLVNSKNFEMLKVDSVKLYSVSKPPPPLLHVFIFIATAN